MTETNSVASLSLDLDNKWSYMKTHGDAGWEIFPSYLDIVVPRVLELLDKHKLTITFFVVGQDAALEENHAALKSIADAGHEIGNHSFHHEPWLHLYSAAEVEAELSRAHEHIEKATGQSPIGFRGPGFSVSETVLRVLINMGYKYDCSTFPTFLGPLARAYYFLTMRLTPEEKAQRKKLFGTFSEGLRPNKPYTWLVDASKLTEIPVTTMPLIKIPIHASYILYLAKFSPAIAMLYFRTAIKLCRLTGVQPSILLHPLDFMTLDDAPELAFFPAMHTPLAKKLDVMAKIFNVMTDQFEVLSMQAHVEHIRSTQALRTIVPKFGDNRS
ncbi:MAG: polysaccharide deacetylase [Chloroflexi bacterium]|nr:MAG: polysaccharide deacetylase [Phototrophicales bacterium]RMF77379.1 MAG: polysaccharide deacetylase [Chloroflexota bacterium]